MEWFKKFAADVDSRYPWIVKFEDKPGGMQEIQVAGESAQDVVNYIRQTHDIKTVYFVAKIDNDWT